MSGLDNVKDVVDLLQPGDSLCCCETWEVEKPVLPESFDPLGLEVEFVAAEKVARKGHARGGLAVFYKEKLFEYRTLNSGKTYDIFVLAKFQDYFRLNLCSPQGKNV